MYTIELISHVVITVIAVAALAVRIEHRLTKIETEVIWMIRKIDRLNGADDLDK